MMRAFAVALVLLGNVVFAGPVSAREAEACRACREDHSACIKAHSKDACKTNYDICLRHCRPQDPRK